MGNRNKKRKRITRLESPPLQRLSARISLSPSSDVPVVSQTQESPIVESPAIGSPTIESPSAIARASLQSPVKVDNDAIKAMVNGHQPRPQQSNLELVKRPSYATLTATNVLSFLRDPLIDASDSRSSTTVTNESSVNIDEPSIYRECQNFFGKITYT